MKESSKRSLKRTKYKWGHDLWYEWVEECNLKLGSFSPSSLSLSFKPFNFSLVFILAFCIYVCLFLMWWVLIYVFHLFLFFYIVILFSLIFICLSFYLSLPLSTFTLIYGIHFQYTQLVWDKRCCWVPLVIVWVDFLFPSASNLSQI